MSIMSANEESQPTREQEPSQEEAVKAIFELAASELKKGVPPKRLESVLMARGLDQESASAVVRKTIKGRSKAIRAEGKKDMVVGALWCVGGTVVTVATYLSAAGGGTYVVAWGAILFGGIQFVRGLIRSSTG